MVVLSIANVVAHYVLRRLRPILCFEQRLEFGVALYFMSGSRPPVVVDVLEILVQHPSYHRPSVLLTSCDTFFDSFDELHGILFVLSLIHI